MEGNVLFTEMVWFITRLRQSCWMWLKNWVSTNNKYPVSGSLLCDYHSSFLLRSRHSWTWEEYEDWNEMKLLLGCATTVNRYAEGRCQTITSYTSCTHAPANSVTLPD